MKAGDVIASAVRNTFRAKLRTTLTVIAIVIGAFTLTLTNAVGAGISSFIDTQVGAIGAPGVLTITPLPDEGTSEGPEVYDPERAGSGGGFAGVGGGLNDEDIERIAEVPGIQSVVPAVSLQLDYIETPGSEQYVMSIDVASGLFVPDLAAGAAVSDSAQPEVLLEGEYVEPLGFADAEAAIGQTVTFGVTDALGEHHEVEAIIAGVMNPGLLSFGAEANQALADALLEAQQTGITGDVSPVYFFADATADPASTEEELQAIKDALVEAGFEGTTVADRIGAFKTVIDVVTSVLNAFAVIALLAAGFGIVNTLLMSVQERTREIGLMKAMGMRSGKVFGLFSTEAMFIGFLGSVIGAGLAIALGLIVNPLLGDTLFADLPGLQIVRFEPLAILVIVGVVMAIAFLAGTLPARRAAAQHPIDALRYE